MAVPKSVIDPLAGVRFGDGGSTYADVLTPGAVAFVADLRFVTVEGFSCASPFLCVNRRAFSSAVRRSRSSLRME